MKYTVRAAARATGISESRLRTWERRYGLPKPGRSSSGRRLYSEQDLDVIRRMAGFVDAGVPAAQAAEAARSELSLQPARTTTAREHPLVAEIADAATTYDEAAIKRAIDGSLEQLSWEHALDDVLMPALFKIGIEWRESNIVSANEHFASEIIRARICAAVATTEAAPDAGPTLILACPTDERHDIGLLGLNLMLRRRSVRVYYLGADVPEADLLSAVRDIQPDAVCLASVIDSSRGSLARAARAIVRSRIRTRVFIGGPAIGAEATAAPGIRLPERIAEAADAIVRALNHDGQAPVD